MSAETNTTCHSFRSLFWKLSRDEFPSFAELLGLGQGLGEHATPLVGDLKRHAQTALDAVSTVCQEHDVRPLITELAIIADRRMLSEGEEYFVSYMRADKALDSGAGEAAKIMAVYVNALQLMKQDEGEPIVPHPQLYAIQNPGEPSPSSNGLFTLNTDLQIQPELAAIADKPQYGDISGLRYKFTPLLSPPKQRVSDRIDFYRACLLEILSADPALAESRGVSLLRKSAFVVVPFIRPYYQSAALSRDETNSRDAWQAGAPGGVLFVFLIATGSGEAKTSDARLIRLGRDLQSLLSIAGLVESYSSLTAALSQKETEQRLNRVLDGVAHTALNTLGAIGSQMACEVLGNGVPPTKLKYKLIDCTTGERSEAFEDEVARNLASAFLAEEAVRGFLSLGRILGSNIEVLDRFCARSDYDLREQINLAVQMVAHRSRLGGGDIYHLEVRSFTGHCRMAKGYLEGRMIRSIVYELLLNCAKYGLPPEESGDVVPVDITIATEGEDAVHIRIADPVFGQEWENRNGLALPPKLRRASYLVRFAEFCRALTPPGQDGGIRIQTSVGPGSAGHVPSSEQCDHYIAQLSLATLQVFNAEMRLESRKPVAVATNDS